MTPLLGDRSEPAGRERSDDGPRCHEEPLTGLQDRRHILERAGLKLLLHCVSVSRLRSSRR